HTPALRLGDSVPEEGKAERLGRLFEVSDELSARYLPDLVSELLDVWIEGRSKARGRWVGRSQRHELVHVAGAAEQNLIGQLVRARVSRANKRSLFADLDSQLTAAPARLPL